MELNSQISCELRVDSFYSELIPIIHGAEKKASDTNCNLDSRIRVGRSTLWRWANTLNKELPDPYKTFALLRYESGKQNIKEVASFYGGQVEKFLKVNFSSEFTSTINQNFDPLQEPHFNDYFSFVIFTLCGTDRKITLNEIKKTIGQISLKNSMIPVEDWDENMIMAHGKFAEKKVNELVSAGYLKIEKDYVIRTKKNLHLNVLDKIDFIAKNIPTFFKIENVEKKMNGLHFFYSSVTPNYAKKLAREIKDFFVSKRDEASTNTDPNGIPIHTIFFMDTLLSDPINEDKEGGILQ